MHLRKTVQKHASSQDKIQEQEDILQSTGADPGEPLEEFHPK